ncbi:hypothetical protein LCGC14_0737680 [marine sediment metagenome]|uniref:Uncharacterized protein n=1 Tax=marine sediment metagenome TaxID=412755 RepID=A0A0F9QSL7_9ZZZZ
MTKTITCGCGAIIRGSSKDHAKANLKIHEKSRRHKELIKLKKAQQRAPTGKDESLEQ